jgi:formamidopyrimidine-DNA glycosylase
MPELPEVETVRRNLEPHLTGKTITSFTLHWHRTLQTPDLPSFVERVTARTITSVGRRGKLLAIHLDDGSTITVHLRMTGELLFVSAEGLPPDPERARYLRAQFSFADGSILSFYDTRKFGKIAWHSAAGPRHFDAGIGLEPLSDDFTADALAAALATRRRQLKPLLLDQRIIAGLGNIYVDEALHRARLHPLSIASGLAPSQISALHEAIVTLLERAVESRGTTLRDYRSGLGEEGGYQRSLQVYGHQAGTPCPRCASPLERLVVGQRGTVFCPGCQVLVKPDSSHR